MPYGPPGLLLGSWDLSYREIPLFFLFGSRLVHSSSLLKATKTQTTGSGVLKQNLSLRTRIGNYCCSLSGWWCWTTSSATLVSSCRRSHCASWLGGAGRHLEACRADTRGPSQDEVCLSQKGLENTLPRQALSRHIYAVIRGSESWSW